MRVIIHPVHELEPLDLSTRGRLRRISGISATSNLPSHIARRQQERAHQRLKEKLGVVPKIHITDKVSSAGQGTLLFLILESEGVVSGFSALGRRGKPAEGVADEAVDQLIEYVDSGRCVDPHLSDQLIPFLGLAKGRSVFSVSRITRHLITNVWVVQQFLDIRIDVKGREGEPGRVEIHL